MNNIVSQGIADTSGPYVAKSVSGGSSTSGGLTAANCAAMPLSKDETTTGGLNIIAPPPHFIKEIEGIAPHSKVIVYKANRLSRQTVDLLQFIDIDGIYVMPLLCTSFN